MILRALLLLLLIALPATAQTAEVRTSQLFECFLLLNAASPDPRFRIPEVEARWAPLIQQDKAAAQVMRQWQGEGLSLCYLFTDWYSRTPERVANLLDNSEMPGGPANDPHYARILKKAELDPHSLAVWLQFVQRNTLPAVPDEAIMAMARSQAASTEGSPWREPLEKLLDLEHVAALPIYVTNLSGQRSYILQGQALGISASVINQMKYLMPKELAHKFVATPGNLDWLKWLDKRDPYYAKASLRIHKTHGQSDDEELVTAASLYAATRGGLITKKQALRYLCGLYQTSPQECGSPLATILYAHLMENRDPVQNYSSWLATESHRSVLQPGKIEAAAQKIVENVRGNAGILIEGHTISSVAPGQAASSAGLRSGDKIVSIDGNPVSDLSSEEILDRICGPVGSERKIRVERGSFTVKLH